MVRARLSRAEVPVPHRSANRAAALCVRRSVQARHTAPFRLEITNESEGVEPWMAIVVDPGVEQLVSTDSIGSVRFRYGTQLLGVVRNRKQPCR